MIIREIHWEVKQRYNKLDSNFKKDLTPMEIDALIWDVVVDYVDIFYSGNNSKQYKFGFEVTQQRIDMLSSLVISKPLQPSLTPDSISDDKYEFYLSEEGQLVAPYFHLIRAYATTDCGIVNVKIERHNDLNYVLEDAYRKPSRKWKRLVGVIESSTNSLVESSLYVHSEPGFVITSLDLEFIKCPVRPYFGGYNSIEYNNCVATSGASCTTNFDNVSLPTLARTIDIPSKYHPIVVDMAVQELSRRLEDGNRFGLRKEKIQTIT